MPTKKLKTNSNGKLPTAKDFEMPKNLTESEKRRIETSRAALEAMIKEKVYEKTGV